MTQDEAKHWLHLFGDTPDDLRCVCENGHAECSVSPGGPCLDDVIKLAIPNED